MAINKGSFYKTFFAFFFAHLVALISLSAWYLPPLMESKLQLTSQHILLVANHKLESETVIKAKPGKKNMLIRSWSVSARLLERSLNSQLTDNKTASIHVSEKQPELYWIAIKKDGKRAKTFQVHQSAIDLNLVSYGLAIFLISVLFAFLSLLVAIKAFSRMAEKDL